jgi:hypothetical protein
MLLVVFLQRNDDAHAPHKATRASANTTPT